MAVYLGYNERYICCRKGEALINLHRYNEAEDYYKSMIERYSNEYYLNGRIACAEFYQEKYEASKEIYDSIQKNTIVEKKMDALLTPLSQKILIPL